MFKSIIQFCFVLMSAMLISASPASLDIDENRLATHQQQHDLVTICESMLNDLASNSLVKGNESNFNRCLSYYMAKFLAAETVSESEEAVDDEPFMARETRRVKGVKNFWKRSRSGKGVKKFW